jgi:hypothetical protein
MGVSASSSMAALFPGRPSDRVNKLAAEICRPEGGLVNRYRSTTPGKLWLEVLLIHPAELESVDIQMFHEAYRPHDEKHRGIY